MIIRSCTGWLFGFGQGPRSIEGGTCEAEEGEEEDEEKEEEVSVCIMTEQNIADAIARLGGTKRPTN